MWRKQDLRLSIGMHVGTTLLMATLGFIAVVLKPRAVTGRTTRRFAGTRVKIVDPSFFNWPALPVALQDTIVPDFPLTNKSFNLSYAGNDL